MRKWLIRLPVILAMAVIAISVAWYSTSFLPYTSELHAMAAQGNKEAATVIDVLYPLAIAGETAKGIRVHAMRQAYRSLVFSSTRQGMMTWHFENGLWYAASHLHFDNGEVFGLWAKCVYGCDRGLSYAAEEYFSREMTELTCHEIAELVVMVRYPMNFWQEKARYSDRVEAIVEKAIAQDSVPRLTGDGDCLNQ